MDNAIIAVRKHGEIISIGCGKYCFSIVGDVPVKDKNIEEFYKKQNQEKLKEYNEAYELCGFAYQNNMYDGYQEN